MNLKIPRP